MRRRDPALIERAQRELAQPVTPLREALTSQQRRAIEDRRHRKPTRPKAAPVTDPVAALLHEVAQGSDRGLIAQAIAHDAAHHGGEVNPNRVREALRPRGIWRIKSPQQLSATYSAMCSAGVLALAGQAVIEGSYTGNNSGKTVGLYRLTERGRRALTNTI